MATKMGSQNKISVEMVSSTFKKEEAGSYQLPPSEDCKLPSDDLVKHAIKSRSINAGWEGVPPA